MNILVTTPKSEIENSRKEGDAIADGEGYWFRTFHFKPKVNEGDRIYFTENGVITGYGRIFKVATAGEKGFQCETTGRVWGRHGDYIVCYDNWHWIKPQIKFNIFLQEVHTLNFMLGYGISRR
jgi:hypothetical protein